MWCVCISISISIYRSIYLSVFLFVFVFLRVKRDFWDADKSNKCLISGCDLPTDSCPVLSSMRVLFTPGPTHSTTLRTWRETRHSATASWLHPSQVPSSQGNNPILNFFFHMEWPSFPSHYCLLKCHMKTWLKWKCNAFPTYCSFALHARMALCNPRQPARHAATWEGLAYASESAGFAPGNGLVPSLVRVLLILQRMYCLFLHTRDIASAQAFSHKWCPQRQFSTPFSWLQQVGNTDPKGRAIIEPTG